MTPTARQGLLSFILDFLYFTLNMLQSGWIESKKYGHFAMTQSKDIHRKLVVDGCAPSDAAC